MSTHRMKMTFEDQQGQSLAGHSRLRLARFRSPSALSLRGELSGQYRI